ncbi:SRPBCC family protein [Rhodoligotrophos defluvii]|uniref:SRPBCC family protein n=1 Tax=Rhodoligotrophos defluvii TaxID=2561934 RepID=UPI0010CA1AB4|nr:SRPBCC family protein [Rhodoligotrophos defluvii]
MKLHNEFAVPLPPKEAWALLNQVERVAPCFPGAQLLEARDDGSYVGTVSVRLGPVALSFRGTAVYEEVDEANLRVKARASGNEQRARGTARANVVFQVVPDGAGSRVLIDTDLQLAGAIAQYARGGGMIETTAQVMIDDFARNLQAQLERDKQAGSAAADMPEMVSTSAAAPSQPAPASRPPSLLRIMWLAITRYLFGRVAR